MLVKDNDHIAQYLFRSNSIKTAFGLAKQSTYDTLIFTDKISALEYPLVVNQGWKIRDVEDPYGDLSLEKTFLGFETLDFESQRIQCAKLRLVSFINKDSWVSNFGLIKASIDFGVKMMRDSFGGTKDEVQSSEHFQLLKINPSENEILHLSVAHLGKDFSGKLK